MDESTLKAFVVEANAWFDRMSEEDQGLHLLAQSISGASSACSIGIPKEEVARQVIMSQRGPKFVDRVLKDPSCRKKLGLK